MPSSLASRSRGVDGLLWWNEGRTARTESMLASARCRVLSLGAGDDASLLERAAADGHSLVHLSSTISTASGVGDDVFEEVGLKDALCFRRHTEAYQWEEIKHVSERRVSEQQVERRTTYSYQPRWKSHRVSSSAFENRRYFNPNPRLPPGTTDTFAWTRCCRPTVLQCRPISYTSSTDGSLSMCPTSRRATVASSRPS